jgi:NAD(P)-dependent dehydrogenase (short-subunit alcohol dehydrogenase family)
MKRPLMCSGDLLDRDLSGHTYIVTGGNSGIGLVTVQQLAKQGATVVLACRRPAEGEKVAQEVRTHGVSGQIVVMALDLSSLESVRDFARDFLAAFSQLNGLVNNAGVMNTPYGRTVDGFEMQFGVNHLGHYLLTELLLDRIRHTAPSRIVCVSSAYHDKAFGREGRIDFDDLHFERRRYDGWEAYAQSKLANVLHARALARRLEGSGVTAVSLHPGWVRTDMGGQGADIDVGTSISGMVEVIADATRYPSGGFYDYRGESIEW